MRNQGSGFPLRREWRLGAWLSPPSYRVFSAELLWSVPDRLVDDGDGLYLHVQTGFGQGCSANQGIGRIFPLEILFH